MVELRAEAAVCTSDSRGKQSHFESEFSQQPGEGAIHLVTEAAAFLLDNLVHEAGLIANDRTLQPDIKIFEGDVEQVGTVKLL